MPNSLMSAAQYLRMSTEHQRYSFDDQSTASKRYADEHGFEIIKNYEDPAKSRLLIRDRPGLRAMSADVLRVLDTVA